uniref:Uncharacterized protein n=1 Tax=Oryza nivara TaxID=4536 RepID=A0A0E0I8T1_ORYNI
MCKSNAQDHPSQPHPPLRALSLALTRRRPSPTARRSPTLISPSHAAPPPSSPPSTAAAPPSSHPSSRRHRSPPPARPQPIPITVVASVVVQDSRRRHRSPPTDHPPPIPARIHVAADAFRRLVAADTFRLDLLLDATDPRRRLALNRSPSPPSSRRLALAIVSPQGIADGVYLAKDYIHVIAWVSTSLISFARNSIGKPRQSGPPTRRQDSIPCLVDLLRRRAAGSCIDTLRPRSLPRSSPHCRINVDVARLASLLSGTSYLRQRVAVSSIKALLSPLLEAPPPFLLDNAVRVDAADIKDL